MGGGARTKAVRGRKIPVRSSSDPGKNEEKGGTTVVEYLQILEKIALIRACIILLQCVFSPVMTN